MSTGDLITQKEAAAILNRSQSAISRAIHDGRLEYADPVRRLIFRPMLEQRFARKTRPRIDAPQRKTQGSPGRNGGLTRRSEPISQDYWERLADKLGFALKGAPAYWSEAPDPQRLRLFCRTLDELRSQVELEGLKP